MALEDLQSQYGPSNKKGQVGTGKKVDTFAFEGQKNKGLEEIGIRVDTNEVVIRVDPRYFRPTEVEQLLGDASKARKELNWKNKIPLKEIISEMIEEDSNEAKKEFLLKSKGFSTYSPKE